VEISAGARAGVLAGGTGFRGRSLAEKGSCRSCVPRHGLPLRSCFLARWQLRNSFTSLDGSSDAFAREAFGGYFHVRLSGTSKQRVSQYDLIRRRISNPESDSTRGIPRFAKDAKHGAPAFCEAFGGGDHNRGQKQRTRVSAPHDPCACLRRRYTIVRCLRSRNESREKSQTE
jgi:hypothetical protein